MICSPSQGKRRREHHWLDIASTVRSLDTSLAASSIPLGRVDCDFLQWQSNTHCGEWTEHMRLHVHTQSCKTPHWCARPHTDVQSLCMCFTASPLVQQGRSANKTHSTQIYQEYSNVRTFTYLNQYLTWYQSTYIFMLIWTSFIVYINKLTINRNWWQPCSEWLLA